MPITGRTIVTVPAAAETATTLAMVDAVKSLRKRLAMEQDLQVDVGDIRTEDALRNIERSN